jgi:hypothetical protein
VHQGEIGRSSAWKVIPGVAERLALVVVYGVMMLASQIVITCGLMVVFN